MAAASRPFWPITTRRPSRGSSAPQLPVVVMLHARADRLHDEAHRLAGDRRKALDAQDVVARDEGHQPLDEGCRCRELAQAQREARELVVVVVGLVVVVRGAALDVALARKAEAEEHFGVHRAMARAQELDRRAERRLEPGGDALERGLGKEIGLVEDHEVGAASWSSKSSSSGLSCSSVGSAAACAPSAAGSLAKRPSATAGPSTTAMTPSTVTRVRMSGQLKAWTSGFGSAKPEVSITIWSGGSGRSSSVCIVGRNSSATVQQMQPLASSMMLPSAQLASPQPLRISPSMPTSPNSLMTSARRLPFAVRRRWRMSVVLPAPRKPVMMVTGNFATLAMLMIPKLPAS